MSLQDWAVSGWLRPHQSSAEEIKGLLAIVERDLADAVDGNTSTDWRFGIAYNAALKLCTILLHASGYRPDNTLQHYRTIQALPLILTSSSKDDADSRPFISPSFRKNGGRRPSHHAEVVLRLWC